MAHLRRRLDKPDDDPSALDFAFHRVEGYVSAVGDHLFTLSRDPLLDIRTRQRRSRKGQLAYAGLVRAVDDLQRVLLETGVIAASAAPLPNHARRTLSPDELWALDTVRRTLSQRPRAAKSQLRPRLKGLLDAS